MDKASADERLLPQTTAPTLNKYSGYVRLFFVWLACIICGGITPGINLFIPRFAESGLFADACDPAPPCKAQTLLIVNVFAVEQSMVALGFLPAGMLFDFIGGRLCGVLGALGVGLGALLVLAALSMQSATALGLAASLMDLSNLIAVAGFTGLMWHLPEAQGMLFSLSMASTTTAAVLPVILNRVMDFTGMSFDAVFLAYASIAAASSFIMFVVVPTQKEFFAQADHVLGIPVPPPPPPSWKGFKDAVYMGGLVVKMQRKDVFMCSLAGAFSTVAGMVYQAELVSFATQLFGDQTVGTALADFDTESTAILSVVGAIFSGYIIDHYSIGVLAIVIVFLTAIMLSCNPIENYMLQQLCSFSNRSIQIFCPPIMFRFIAYWAPSHRYGMVQGVVSGMNAIMTLIFMVFSTVISGMEDGVSSYTFPTRIFGVLSLMCWAFFAYRLVGVPMPGTVLLEGDEEEMMWENFGLKTFEDVENVLEIPRSEILRLLASQDLSERRKLIDVMKEPEVQTRWAQRAYRQGYELPELDYMTYALLVASDLERTLTGFVVCDSGKQPAFRTPRGGGRSARAS